MDGDTAIYERHRDLTILVHRTDSEGGPIGDFHVGVAEWNLETGASLRTAGQALEYGRRAIDAHIDAARPRAECLTLSGADPIPATEKGLVVETGSGAAKVFYNAVAESPEEDPYLAETGWYYQPLESDEPPAGPYDDHEEAEGAAVSAMARHFV